MTDCRDLETIVALEEALGWEAERALRHILSCEECIAGVRQVERLHAALDRALDPTAGFADRVLAALPQTTPAVRRSWADSPALLSAGIFVLASVTTVLILAVAAITSPGAGGLRPEIAVLAALVGFAAVKVTPPQT